MHSSDGKTSEIFDCMKQSLNRAERLFVEAHFGPRSVGYRWRNLFLPNGTTLRVRHGRRRYSATVTYGELIFNGQPSSPAKMMFEISDGQDGNPWETIYLYRPGDTDWRIASQVREEDGTKDVRRFDRPCISIG